MATTLFDRKPYTFFEPGNYLLDEYEYYNDNGRPEIGIIRDQLEKWFSEYPDDWKDDLKHSFKAAFPHAFYELFIHQLFTKLGYALEVHPEMSNKDTHPDFLATTREERLYIEVRHLDLLSDKAKGITNSINTLYDSINRNVDPTNFFLYIRKVIFKNGSQPSGKSVSREINKYLATLDPDHLTELLKTHEFDALETVSYEDDRLLLEYAAIPKSPEGRGTKTRPIGLISGNPIFGNDSDRIQTALERKSSKYGRFDAPFIICLNKQTPGLDKMELQQALYGNIVASFSENPANRNHKSTFDFSGFFGSKNIPSHTRVSGVYFTNANPANLGSTAKQMIRHHPGAQYLLSQRLTDLINQKKIGEIFDISQNYPLTG